MTGARVYGTPRTIPEALAEVRRLAGIQFYASAVEALLRIHADTPLGSPGQGADGAGLRAERPRS